jgi:hypothetical protein
LALSHKGDLVSSGYAVVQIIYFLTCCQSFEISLLKIRRIGIEFGKSQQKINRENELDSLIEWISHQVFD